MIAQKGKHGCGTLVKRGGVYYAAWMFNGRMHRVSTHETTEREARKRLEEIVENFRKGHKAEAVLESVKESLQRVTRRNLPISDAFAVYEKSKLRKPIAENTMRVYRGRLGVFAEWARGKVESVDDVTPDVARRFMESIADGISPKTFNDYLAVLALVWKTLVKNGYTASNPWTYDRGTGAGIERREKDPHRKSELSPAQLDALFNATSGEMRTLFFIGIYTGLRLKDCALLKWESVDFAGGFIRLAPAKTRRHGVAVSIPILPPLANALQAARDSVEDGGGGYVLPELAAVYQRRGSILSSRIETVFRRAGIAATSTVEGRSRKVTDFGFHSLRHTFVSMAARAGIRQAVVQSIVGHTSRDMTAYYTHTNEADAAAAMAAFPVLTITDGAEARTGGAEAVEGADTPAEGETRAETRLEALAAILAQMDADELKRAAAMVKDERKRRGA